MSAHLQVTGNKVYVEEENLLHPVITTNTSENIKQKITCMCCMKTDIFKPNSMKFNQMKYDMKNYWIHELLKQNEVTH